ncbi:hypothetical protein CFP65_0214 [Kitasatospora sp. MMS16-BH015]|uniref:hypothetical protein n=1 Tax=Kitasatospora sp. MMS16-BH015 TaxID=2018025 RepID=UPI000CA0ED8C|nr:hypothetical protein [Kitasatospora sp. MMS16-BH015]AUG75195.1 hypothetical protein CFP65_0214 [Kitasatospora sp. MMS16-BH015]
MVGIVERLGASVAVVGLVAAGVIGVGAGAAQAATDCGSYRLPDGSSVQVCLTANGSSATVNWTVNARATLRTYLQLRSNCGEQDLSTVNPVGLWSGAAPMACATGGFSVTASSVEGTGQTGGPITVH